MEPSYSCVEEKNLSDIQKSMMPGLGEGINLPSDSRDVVHLGKEIDPIQELMAIF